METGRKRRLVYSYYKIGQRVRVCACGGKHEQPFAKSMMIILLRLIREGNARYLRQQLVSST